jgi:uncharacterized membrane protein
MFIPGMAILKLIKIKNFDAAEKALFSLGLSLSFLMFLGLIINEIGKLAFTNSLTSPLLLLSINVAILMISLKTIKHDFQSLQCSQQLERSERLFLLALTILFLVLGPCGVYLVIISGNSFLLLLMITICVIVISFVFLTRIISNRIYSSVLLIVCVCMMFFATPVLIIKYIGRVGDGPIEFYAFRQTEIKGFWDSTLAPSPYAWNLFPTYSMLSTTILPMIFSAITGADGSLVFQLIYPFVVAFLPLGAYKLYQTQTNDKSALLAAFFFFTVSFSKGWGSYKQQIAQIFYILLFLLILKKDISPWKRKILFIIFNISLVVSHYALALIFLFTIFLTFLILAMIDFIKTTHFSRVFQTKISRLLLLIFLTFTFSWYTFVNAAATFNLINEDFALVFNDLSQFFNLESRGTALQGLGFVETPTIYHRASSALFIFTEFLIVIGFLKLLTRENKNSKYNTEYKVIASINMAIISVNILLPKLADTLLMSRFYQTTLIILAPLAILGGETIIKFIIRPNLHKFSISLLTITVFIPFFLFQTGVVYEIAKVQNYSFALSMYRWDEITLYNSVTNIQEVTGAQWLHKHYDISEISLYSDQILRDSVLTGYGLIERGRVQVLSNTTILTGKEFVYLGRASLNIIDGEDIYNSSISKMLESQNKIYSNGNCDIFKCSTP